MSEEGHGCLCADVGLKPAVDNQEGRAAYIVAVEMRFKVLQRHSAHIEAISGPMTVTEGKQKATGKALCLGTSHQHKLGKEHLSLI